MPRRKIDGPDPIYSHIGYRKPAQVDTASIRRGGELIPDDGVYFFKTAVSSPTSDNVVLTAQLFFLPAVRAQRPQLADWILHYRSRRPSGAPGRVYTLDRDLRLASVR